MDDDWYLLTYPDVIESGVKPIEHFLAFGAQERRNPSPLFVSTWYLERYSPLQSWADIPFFHFLSIGAKLGCDPSELFSVSGYLREHPELDVETVNPLVHFLQHGFDGAWYTAIYPDVIQARMNPLLHYLEHGRAEGRIPLPPVRDKAQRAAPPTGIAPPVRMPAAQAVSIIATVPLPANPPATSRGTPPAAPPVAPPAARKKPGVPHEAIPGFDEAWYRHEYPSLDFKTMSPQTHYLTRGQAEGRHPQFDAQFYIDEYPDVRDAGLAAARNHYEQFGRAQCRHPGFRAAWYAAAYADVKRSGVDPYQHYRRHGIYESRHPAFNQVWYVDNNRDVADASIDPYEHFIRNGAGEGREAAFHRQWYAAQYPDVAETGLDVYEHYRRFGKAEGRLPSGFRSPLLYKARLDHIPAPFTSEIQAAGDFAGLHTDIKAVAFYLPQFHQSPENDAFWGFGFTEWSNVREATPSFKGHYQPRIPHADIGYYDLADSDTLRKQAELVRKFGLYGLCMYHYWFSGKRVLEKPGDILLANPDIDLNFCLCWANENWTRTWDGMDHDVLIRQEYKPEDPQQFLLDLVPFFHDPRYIKIDGSPSS